MSISNGTYQWVAWNPASFSAAATSHTVGDGTGLVVNNGVVTFGGVQASGNYATVNVLNFTATVSGVNYWGILYSLPTSGWLVGAMYISGQNALCSVVAVPPGTTQAPAGSFAVQFLNQSGLNGTLQLTDNLQNPQSPTASYTLSNGPGTVAASAAWNRPWLTLRLTVSGASTGNGTYTLTGFFSPVVRQKCYRGSSTGPATEPDSWDATDAGTPLP